MRKPSFQYRATFCMSGKYRCPRMRHHRLMYGTINFEEIGYKQQVKVHLLKNLRSMVPTRKQPYKVFVDVKYNYDVDTKVLNEIIEHTNDKKVIGNK